MASKRAHSPELVPNPFIKKRNLEWSIELASPTGDAERGGSDAPDGETGAPLAPDQEEQTAPEPRTAEPEDQPRSAAVEAGRAHIADHLAYFRDLAAQRTLRPYPAGHAHLDAGAWGALWAGHADAGGGAHFVVHQHDHPVAGAHYDLRLQIGAGSSASWALPYGLPGNPCGSGRRRQAPRLAIETRVHCLWNHLVETASAATGSLLVWDTGTYEVLADDDDDEVGNDNSTTAAATATTTAMAGSSSPAAAALPSPRRLRSRPSRGGRPEEDPDSQASSMLPAAPPTEPTAAAATAPVPTQQEKLHAAFQARRIRLRLHGARLPHNYVINLRLPRAEDAAGRARSLRGPTRKRRGGGGGSRKKAPEPVTSSDSEGEPAPEPEPELGPGIGSGDGGGGDDEGVNLSAMERELRELEDDEVRRTNAYPGAINSIGSVHQRRWFLSLDREACGFVKRRVDGRVIWEKGDDASLSTPAATAGSEGNGGDGSDGGRLTFPFYVMGPEIERSVVTGRLAEDVLRDEGVVRFVRRKGWKPILN